MPLKSAVSIAALVLGLTCLASYKVSASLSTGEREEIAAIATEKPRVALEIIFESRSSKIRIRSRAFQTLSALGRALTDPSFDGTTFVIAGHAAVEGRNEE
jgi:hypothetical protein